MGKALVPVPVSAASAQMATRHLLNRKTWPTSAVGQSLLKWGIRATSAFAPQLRQSAEFYPIAREPGGFRVGHQASGFIH